MSRLGPESEKEMREAVEEFIAHPKLGIPSDVGFDSETEAAMLTLMMTPGDKAAIAKVRSSLERQLQSATTDFDNLLMATFKNKRNGAKS